MPQEKRVLQIICSVEPSLFALIRDSSKEEGESLSGYIRRLCIDDQIAKKRLTVEGLASIMTGRSIQRIESLIQSQEEAAG